MSGKEELAKIIHEVTGLALTPDRYYLLESRLREIMCQYEIESFEEVARRFRAEVNCEFSELIIDRISTHETRFFRDESIFDALAMQILPEWAERNGMNGINAGSVPLDIWSAACSSGQEVYSILMILMERYPALLRSLNLTATDVSVKTLARAQEGRYSAFEVDRGLPAHFKDRYFIKTDDCFTARDSLRSIPKFQVHNLLNPAPGRFDIVFCRNVLFYFDEQTRVRSLTNIVNSLKPDGILILGSAESPDGYLENLVIRECGLARYYEPRSTMITLFQKAAS